MSDPRVAEGVRWLLEQQELVRWPTKTAPLPTAITSSGGGAGAVFSLPGQAFVETGRLRLVLPFGGSILWAVASVHIAPTGQAIIIDLNVNGTSVFAGPGDRITIPAGSNVSPLTPVNSQLGAFDYVTVDVDQVGSTLAGGDLTVILGVEGFLGA